MLQPASVAPVSLKPSKPIPDHRSRLQRLSFLISQGTKMFPKIEAMKITSRLVLIIALDLLYVGLLHTAQAVTPPPDGGYAGGNTAEGQSALLNLTTDTYNTALGLFSLQSNTIGSFNTATGAGALLVNTADNNTATGAGALLSNTTGYRNTANGTFVLFSNTTGDSNTAQGFQALFHNTTGVRNTASGRETLISNTTGLENTATGLLRCKPTRQARTIRPPVLLH
jgi:hypothetical protein